MSQPEGAAVGVHGGQPPAQSQSIPVAERLRALEASVAEAARRAGRDPASIRVVLVSKGVEPARIQAAVRCGYRAFGENRAQELASKAAALEGTGALWHFIGYLQRNKVRTVVPLAAWIQSVDRLDLLEEIRRRAERLDRRPQVLIQVNTSGEPSKHGVPPEEAESLVRAAAAAPEVELRGLMTVGPLTEDEAAIRAAFSSLRQLRERLQAEGFVDPARFTELSMGMSADFPIAIEEGATIIRVGTAAFGPRLAGPAPV